MTSPPPQETEDWDDEKEEGDWGDDAVASADVRIAQPTSSPMRFAEPVSTALAG